MILRLPLRLFLRRALPNAARVLFALSLLSFCSGVRSQLMAQDWSTKGYKLNVVYGNSLELDKKHFESAPSIPYLFRSGKIYVRPTAELDSIANLIKRIEAKEASKFVGVSAAVFSSPEGKLGENEKLGKERIETMRQYLKDVSALEDNQLRVVSLGENWQGVVEYLEHGGKEWGKEILRIIEREPDSEARKTAIRNIDNGKSWWRLIRNVYPKLRSVKMIVVIDSEADDKVNGKSANNGDYSAANADSAKVVVPQKPAALVVDLEKNEAEEAQPAQQTQQALSETADGRFPYRRWAVKTNVAYLLATVANIGAEYRFGNRYSVDLPVIYSPYTVSRNYRLRFLAVQPEFRYWLKTHEKGHFFGAHLNIGAFNVSVDSDTRYQSPDGFYGVGLSYGYLLPFAKRWAAEFTVGAGYIYTEYDKYYNVHNGARFEKGLSYNYFGLTKVGVSLVYKFGKLK